MRIGRRSFTIGSAAAAAACARPPGAPTAEHASIADVLDAAIAEAKKAGASYADARFVHRRSEHVATREDHVVSVASSETFGMGVRVIVDGAWGFASAETVDYGSMKSAVAHAIALARAAKTALRKAVELAAAPAVVGTWTTEARVDPFTVPLAEKAAWLLDLWPKVKDVPLVKYASGSIEVLAEHKVFVSTDGSRITQTQTRVWPAFSVTAVDQGQFESRAAEVPPMQAGYEYVTSSSIPRDARKIAEDAVSKLKAPSVTPGMKDLVLAPSNLWLTIHESVGHPTELDRALGLEANFAGTSFATPDKLGKLKYGSDIVTLYADKTTKGGLATCGWDDDGVATQRWDLVRDGLFVGYQTTRDQAAWIGEKASRGTSYAEDHRAVPFQRMPNVSLAPSANEKRLDDVVSATDDGVLVTGTGSWSIDHQRYNFQFSGQMFYAIKGGKIAGPLRDVAYQSNSIEFWNSCDMVGGPSSWELHGTFWDGKGEPSQSNAVSHGCPPARFKNVSVLNVNARGKT